MLVFIFDQIYHLIYCAAGRFFLWDDFFHAHCINYPTIHVLIRMWVHLPMMGGTVLSKQRNDNNRYNDMANLPLPATIAVKSILSYGLGAWSTLPICFCGYYVILTVVANSHFFSHRRIPMKNNSWVLLQSASFNGWWQECLIVFEAYPVCKTRSLFRIKKQSEVEL